VHCTIYMYLYLYSYRRETARQLRMYAQLTRCFSAVAELLVLIVLRINDHTAWPITGGAKCIVSHPTKILGGPSARPTLQRPYVMQ